MVRSNEDRTLLAVLTQGTHGGVPLWMTALRGVADDRVPQDDLRQVKVQRAMVG
jgi:hypothetical protein